MTTGEGPLKEPSEEQINQALKWCAGWSCEIHENPEPSEDSMCARAILAKALRSRDSKIKDLEARNKALGKIANDAMYLLMDGECVGCGWEGEEDSGHPHDSDCSVFKMEKELKDAQRGK